MVSDCSSAKCVPGVPSSDCMYCICSNSITGQVRSSLGRPLINVTISPLNTPDVTLDISDNSGMFEITQACVNQTYTFRADGFVAVDVTFNGITPKNVTMYKRGEKVVHCMLFQLFYTRYSDKGAVTIPAATRAPR